jgi:hypothetical protein
MAQQMFFVRKTMFSVFTIIVAAVKRMFFIDNNMFFGIKTFSLAVTKIGEHSGLCSCHPPAIPPPFRNPELI